MEISDDDDDDSGMFRLWFIAYATMEALKNFFQVLNKEDFLVINVQKEH
jgi:hypothetical protein